MSELSEEEKALLAAADGDGAKRPRRRKLVEAPEESESESGPEVVAAAPPQLQPVAEAPASNPARGPLTPVQYEGDGWGDLPVQMRG